SHLPLLRPTRVMLIACARIWNEGAGVTLRIQLHLSESRVCQHVLGCELVVEFRRQGLQRHVKKTRRTVVVFETKGIQANILITCGRIPPKLVFDERPAEIPMKVSPSLAFLGAVYTLTTQRVR